METGKWLVDWQLDKHCEKLNVLIILIKIWIEIQKTHKICKDSLHRVCKCHYYIGNDFIYNCADYLYIYTIFTNAIKNP